MPSGVSYALTQALGLNRPMDPVRDKANAARAALDAIVGGSTPLGDIRRTPEPAAPVQQPMLGGGGGYSGGGLSAPRGASRFNAGLAAQVPSMFGLRPTSGYRTPAQNRAAGGVPNSRHMADRARDYVGSPAQMRSAAAWAKANGADEVLIHNAGSGTHLHVGW